MAAVPEVTNCKLTISCPRVTNSDLLYQFLTQNLGFKILGISPLVVEKDSPSESDLSRLFRQLDAWPKLELAASRHELCDSLQEKDYSGQGSFKRDANLDSYQDDEEELERLRNSLEDMSCDWELVNGKTELSSFKVEQSESSVQSRQEPYKAPADIALPPSSDNDSEECGDGQREDFGGPERLFEDSLQLSEESKWSTNNNGNNADLSKKRREDKVRLNKSVTSKVNVAEEINPFGISHSSEQALQKNSIFGDGRQFSSKEAMTIIDERCTKKSSEMNNKNINLVENLHQDDEFMKIMSSYNEALVPSAEYLIKEKDEPHCATSTLPPMNSKQDQQYCITHPLEKPRELPAGDTARSIIRLDSKEQERNKKKSLYPDLENDLQDKERINTTYEKSADDMLSMFGKESYDHKGSNLHENNQMSSYEENNDSVKLRGHESTSRINTASSLSRETDPLFEFQPVSRSGEHPGSSHDQQVTSSGPRLTSSSEMRGISGKEQDTNTSNSCVSPFGRETFCDSQPVSRPGEHPGSNNDYQTTLKDPKMTSSSNRGISGKEFETSPPSNSLSSYGRGAPREGQPVPSSPEGYQESSYGNHTTLKDQKITLSSEIRGMSGKEHETSSPSNIVTSFGRGVYHDKEPVPSSGQYPESSYGNQATPRSSKLTSSSENRGMSGKEHETSSPSNIVTSFGRGVYHDKEPVPSSGEYPGNSDEYQTTPRDAKRTSSSGRGMSGKEHETSSPNNNVSSFSRDASRESQPVPSPGGYPGNSYGYLTTPKDPKLTFSSDRGMSGKELETTSLSKNVSSISRDVSHEKEPVSRSGEYPGSSHSYQATSLDPRSSPLGTRGISGKDYETSPSSHNVSSFGRGASRESQLVPSPGEYPGNSHGYKAPTLDSRSSSLETKGMFRNEHDASSPNKNVSSFGRDVSHEKEPEPSPGQYPGSSYGYHTTSYDPKTSLGARGTTGNIASRDKNSYTVRGASGVQVCVLKSSITTLPVDCIVNAANSRLKHADGIAKRIADTAGPMLERDCEEFIKNDRRIEVTDLFVSRGGSLEAKYVIHAVGPKWEAYDDKIKGHCLEDLRHTILRCLVEAGRRGFRSIAIPSISAAKAKVPRNLCAQCYVEAAKIYDNFKQPLESTLEEIYFVDVSESMVAVIREYLQNYWGMSLPPFMLSRDWDFVAQHLQTSKRKEEEAKNKSTLRNKLSGFRLSHDTKNLLSGQALYSSSKTSVKPSYSTVASHGAIERSHPGATAMNTSQKSFTTSQTNKTAVEVKYQFENITLTLSSRRAFDHQPNLTLTVGLLFNELSSILNFNVATCLKTNISLPNMKNHFKFFDVTKPGSTRSLLVCRLSSESESVDNVKEAFKTLDQFYKTIFSSKSGLQRLVFTSRILYTDPKKNKLIPTFAKCLMDSLKVFAKLSFKNIIVTGSEDALPVLMKVLESGKLKKITPEADDSDDQDVDRRVTKDLGTSVDAEYVCKICFESRPVRRPPCCKQNLMCLSCEAKLDTCPWCQKHWKIRLGDQPPGYMTVSVTTDDAAGYENCGSYKIEYLIPAGTQKENHPNPGTRYNSLHRTAYIPMAKQGFQVLRLLRLAFMRRLTFTIGQSMTTNKSDTITWNDIHHKTALRGSPYGYPDPGYLGRVTQELSSKGVTFVSATEEELKELENFENCVQSKDYFSDRDNE